MRTVKLVVKVRLAVGEEALALFGAAGELRQGGEQLRRCIAGGGLRGRYAEDHGEQGFRAARGGQQVFTGGLPGARFGEGFVPRSRSAYFSKHGVEGVGYAPLVFGEGRQMFPSQFAEGAAGL